MNNIIFLDFDGVLNILEGENKTTIRNKKHLISFETELIKNLNDLIIKLENWNIVISSSWKMYGFSFCLQHLIDCGFDINQIYRFKGMTNDKNTRGEEIFEYVKNNNVNNYIIIDDDDFDITGKHPFLSEEIKDKISHHFFKSQKDKGLDKELKDKIIDYIYLMK